MGVTGNPHLIGVFGDMFERIPATEPTLKPETLLGPVSPLSAGLSGMHNLKAGAAAKFARTKDDGIIAAGKALVEISKHLEDFDRQGAAGIKRIIPDPTPSAGDR